MTTDHMREAFEKAKEELAWLKKTAKDGQDLARVVGFEDCLRSWQAALSQPAPAAGDVERVARAIRKALNESFPDNGTTDAFVGRAMDSTVLAWMDTAARAAIAALPACGVSQSENRCKDVCEANSPRPSVTIEELADVIVRAFNDCTQRAMEVDLETDVAPHTAQEILTQFNVSTKEG